MDEVVCDSVFADESFASKFWLLHSERIQGSRHRWQCLQPPNLWHVKQLSHVFTCSLHLIWRITCPSLLISKLVYRLPGFCMCFLYIHHLFCMLALSREYTFRIKQWLSDLIWKDAHISIGKDTLNGRDNLYMPKHWALEAGFQLDADIGCIECSWTYGAVTWHAI